MIDWDEWRGSLDGRATLWVKHVFCRWGRHIDLHKMVRADDPECFHTHPALAFRLVLWGGYVEEIEGGKHRLWFPGRFGLVRPNLSHRVAGLRNGKFSLSLWVRFRKTQTVKLRGRGWANQEARFISPNTEIEETKQ